MKLRTRKMPQMRRIIENSNLQNKRKQRSKGKELQNSFTLENSFGQPAKRNRNEAVNGEKGHDCR